jgi:hypothetical protein
MPPHIPAQCTELNNPSVKASNMDTIQSFQRHRPDSKRGLVTAAGQRRFPHATVSGRAHVGDKADCNRME